MALGAVAAEAQTDSTKALKEVSVSGAKKTIEMETGKTVLNVQTNPAFAGKTAWDLLKNLPGVNTDASGNISISGKQGALVTIEDRPLSLTGEDLMNYLKGITAESVNQIELITQPGARYEAEGNNGIINLKLLKIKRRGWNGSLNATGYQHQYNGMVSTLNLNRRTDKWNVFGSVNVIKAKNSVDYRNDLQFRDSNQSVIGLSTIRSKPTENFTKWNATAGFDYTPNAKNSLGCLLTGAYYLNIMNTTLAETDAMSATTPSSFGRYTVENSIRRNGSVNFYWKKTIDSTHNWNNNFDFLTLTRTMDQSVATEVNSGFTGPTPLYLLGSVPVNIRIGSFRSDYSATLKNGVSLNLGGKYSYNATNNSGDFSVLDGTYWVHDSTRSNIFEYDEQISALYGEASGYLDTAGKWAWKLGLRAEYTSGSGDQKTTEQHFDRSFLSLFPTAFLSYSPSQNNYYEINFGRRTDRPKYLQLNPFRYYTFYNSYQVGNPLLLPEFTYNTELKHSYKSKLTTSLSFSYTENSMNDVIGSDAATATTFGMPANVGSAKSTILSVYYMSRFFNVWDLVLYGYGNYSEFDGVVLGNPAHGGGLSGGLWWSNTFTYKKWTTEASANYSSRTYTSPVTQTEEMLFINFGVSRKLAHDMLIVKAGIDDPFFIYRNNSIIDQKSLLSKTYLMPNSRVGSLSVTWNFGKNKDSYKARANSTEESKRL